jgi:hypothetical protein
MFDIAFANELEKCAGVIDSIGGAINRHPNLVTYGVLPAFMGAAGASSLYSGRKIRHEMDLHKSQQAWAGRKLESNPDSAFYGKIKSQLDKEVADPAKDERMGAISGGLLGTLMGGATGLYFKSKMR